jgi:hypothetical protein
MNVNYREALPHLHKVLVFHLEEISAVDLFYNDGDSRVRESLFKLVLPRENHSVAVVYIQEGSFWVSFGSLTERETQAIHDWITCLKN